MPEENGQNAGGGNAVDLNSPEVQTAIAAAVKTATDGLVRKRDELLNEVKTAKSRLKDYEDIDPEAARKALEESKKLEEKKLMDEGQIEELFKKRSELMVKEHEKALKRMQDALEATAKERDTHLNKLSEVLVDTALQQAAASNGVRAQAMEDVLLRGKRVWQLHEGKPIAKKGDEILYGKNPNQPMTMEEWIIGLQADAPHLFEATTGGGAAGGAKGTVTTGGKRLSLDQPNVIGENLEAILKGEANFG